MNASNVIVENQGPVAVLRLNRPKRLNALNNALISELVAALEACDRDGTTRVAIITGDERAFAAGADIGELAVPGGPQLDHVRCRLPALAAGIDQQWVAGFGIRKRLGAQLVGIIGAQDADRPAGKRDVDQSLMLGAGRVFPGCATSPGVFADDPDPPGGVCVGEGAQPGFRRSRTLRPLARALPIRR